MELSDLIESVNIVEYISQFVELEEKGGEWWGLSCFKEENTPSFSVRESPPCFFDFSSGKSGNIIHFIRCYNHCSFQEAVEILKKYAGVNGDVQPTKRLAAVEVAKKYKGRKKQIKNSQVKTLPDDYMLRYEKNPEKLAIWEAEGISKASLERFQVAYDSFSDRLVYPIRNVTGEIVNVGARTLDPDWKQKKLRKYSYLFSWDGGMNTVFGIAENKEDILLKKEIIIFEGAKSVMIAYSWGIRNCGALLTSHLSQFQMKILAKLGVRVVFALDKEVVIRDDPNISKLKRYVTTEYIWDRDNLLDEKDSPVDKGVDAFMKLYEGRLQYR
jgi:DNA primase